MDDGYRGLRLTNTMTRRKEEFRPLDWRNPAVAEAERRVRMYVCGPTVYDLAHIGNARPVVVFDVLFRLLRHLYGERGVVYVRNITDVDDKINARAARDHPDLPLNEAIARVTASTGEQYAKDVAALGNLAPTVEPRATDYMNEMRAMIDRLVAGGHAYVANNNVLFHTPSMPDYGQLSRRSADDLIAGARVEVSSFKKDPTDFVLWKPSNEGEPGWPSPAGIASLGRPGWHIECSAMSEKHLGPEFDIHGGGLDLVFPHHENEIAQSRCVHGTDAMAQIWMHNGMLQVDGRKMSKSEGNFITLRDLLETPAVDGRTWPGEVVRLVLMKTHYREPLDFTANKLEDAANELDRWERAARDAGVPADGEPDGEFLAHLSDDLALSAAFARVHQLFGEGRIAPALASLALLGLHPVRGRALPGDAAALIEQRLGHLKEKNFTEADRIRADLAGRGIQLKDGKDPATGERITTWELKR